MTEQTKRKPGFLILVLAIVVIFVLVAVILIFPPSGEGDGNGGEDPEDIGPWGDLSKMKASINEIVIFNYDEVSGPHELDDVLNEEETVYMMIGVEKEFISDDLISIGDFAKDGGKVIIADDGTNTNRLANYMYGIAGGKPEFTGHNYLSDNTFLEEQDGMDPGWVHNIRFIRGYSLPVRGQVYNVLTDSPKGLYVSGPARMVLTTTKNLTIIDLNDNGEMDQLDGEFEPHVPYGPIAVKYDIGTSGGSITYISTTGIFTDSMFSEANNEGFIRAYLLSMIPDGGDVLLDDSRQLHRFSPHTTVIPS